MAKTPKEYTENIKKGIITKNMLKDCLFSVNKRAKNYRDKEREYRQYNKNMHSWNRYYYDKYDNEGQARAKKEEYYEQKEIMLSILNPVCIHKEKLGYVKERIYDYQDKYSFRNTYKKNNKILWENCYYDDDLDREVYFFDINSEKIKYNYYLFYELEDHSFHTPITEEETKNYNLKIYTINHLQTEGHDISDLISCQFCKKLIELIQTNNYTYIEK